MLGTDLAGKGGVAAVVAVLRDDGLFEREAVRYLPTHREGSGWQKTRAAVAAFWRTIAICCGQAPALVHVHSASHASFRRKSLLLLIARVAGCRTVFHLHGGGFRRFAESESGPFTRWWIRHTLRRSSAVIALSPNWADFLRAFAPGVNVVVVPNSVRLPASQSIAAASVNTAIGAGDSTATSAGVGTARAGVNAPTAAINGIGAGATVTTSPTPCRVLFLGRAEAAKGAFDLLAAIGALVPTFPGIELVIGGDGALDDIWRRAEELGIANHLILPGWLNPAQKQVELERAAIFCLPSHAEGLPMAMLEAMAAGKAVVVSSVGAVPEVIEDGINGLLTPPGNVPELVAALSRVLGDDVLRAALGRQANATIAARYSTEVVIGSISALYADLVGGP